jgi:lipoprotein-releasing system ATP-binding protein
MTSAPLLELIGAVKEYGARVKTQALAGVDLTIESGEFVALIGPSGSGKSTLLNLIGLLDRPTRGRVVVDGVDTTLLDDAGLTALRARKLGFVFQFHHLLPAFTALENVMLPEWGDTGFASADLRARAAKLLDEVGLAERKGYRTTDLSGGQQQRVAIARALVRRPPLVLADEPTGNLDTESSKEVLALMRRFHREAHTTFLIVTHDPRIAAQCDRVVEIVDGRVHDDRRNGAAGVAPPATPPGGPIAAATARAVTP